MKTELRRVLDAVEAFLDPEDNMPAETGEFNELKACIPVLQSLLATFEAGSKTQVDQMVDRFLGWKLPADFAPDAGITFKPQANPGSPIEFQYTHKPVGTNLFTADQARGMFEHCIGDLDAVCRIAELEEEVAHLRAVAKVAVSFLNGDEVLLAKQGG